MRRKHRNVKNYNFCGVCACNFKATATRAIEFDTIQISTMSSSNYKYDGSSSSSSVLETSATDEWDDGFQVVGNNRRRRRNRQHRRNAQSPPPSSDDDSATDTAAKVATSSQNSNTTNNPYSVPDDTIQYRMFRDVHDWDELRDAGLIVGSLNLKNHGIKQDWKWWHGYDFKGDCILQFTTNSRGNVFVNWIEPTAEYREKIHTLLLSKEQTMHFDDDDDDDNGSGSSGGKIE